MESKITPELIEQLKTKNAGCALNRLEHRGVEVVVKVPDEMTWRKFTKAIRDEKRRDEASERLVFDCLVWPEAVAFLATSKALPAIVSTFASDLCEMAGLAAHSEVTPL